MAGRCSVCHVWGDLCELGRFVSCMSCVSRAKGTSCVS